MADPAALLIELPDPRRGVSGDGSAHDSANLLALQLLSNSVGGTIRFHRGTYRIQHKITQAATAAWDLDPGVTFQIDAAGALTLNGVVNGPIAPIFTGSTGNVAFGAMAAGQRAEWSGGSTAYLHIPTSASDPVGTPATTAGYVPVVYSLASHKIFVFDTGTTTWKGVLLS